LALCLWRAAPGRFVELDRWMFAPPRPPAVADVRSRIVDWVGEDRLRIAEYDPAVPLAVRTAVATCATLMNRPPPMPIVLLPRAVLFGQLPGAEELMRILREQLFHAPPPAPATYSPFAITPIRDDRLA
jgi:hypothetical protein